MLLPVRFHRGNRVKLVNADALVHLIKVAVQNHVLRLITSILREKLACNGYRLKNLIAVKVWNRNGRPPEKHQDTLHEVLIGRNLVVQVRRHERLNRLNSGGRIVFLLNSLDVGAFLMLKYPAVGIGQRY